MRFAVAAFLALVSALVLRVPAQAAQSASTKASETSGVKIGDTWNGTISLPGGVSLDFSVSLGKNSGTISIPAQGAKDIPLSDVSATGEQLKFVLKPAGAPEVAWAKFDLKVAADGGSAEGLLRQNGGEFPVKASKGEAAKLVAAKDGDTWAGPITLPGGITLDFSVNIIKDTGTISIPAQGAKDLPLSEVSTADSQLKFVIKPAGAPEAAWARFELKIASDGHTAEGVLRQGDGEFPVKVTKLAPGEAPKVHARPQEPKAPFPYEVEDVSFDNKAAGIKLAGTLVRPSTPGPHPAVVMITGSGPQDRDEALLGHRPFLVIADHLVRNGIAVLRYDDRGVAKSTGNFAEATSDDFATDAVAGVEYLLTRPEIDHAKVGVMGHSEGGLIAPIVAGSCKDVAFIVLLAGTGVPGADVIVLQGKLINMAMGKSEADAEAEAQKSRKIMRMIAEGADPEAIKGEIRAVTIEELKADPSSASLSEDELNKKAEQLVAQQVGQMGSKWWKRFLVLDPRDFLRKFTCPVLAINGSHDLQVPPSQNLGEIEKALKAGGNTDVTVKELPELNHLFQHSKTGAPSEYSTIEETFAPEALDVVTAWIRARTGLK
ncbi:MAG: alpha/beta fold hydrolase [Phycisphaerales bacterium]